MKILLQTLTYNFDVNGNTWEVTWEKNDLKERQATKRTYTATVFKNGKKKKHFAVDSADKENTSAELIKYIIEFL